MKLFNNSNNNINNDDGVMLILSKNKEYEKGNKVHLSIDDVKRIAKVLQRNHTKGIGIPYNLTDKFIKSFVTEMYDSYESSKDVFINVFDENCDLKEEIVKDVPIRRTKNYRKFIKAKIQREEEDKEMNKIMVNKRRVKLLMTSVAESGYQYIPILVTRKVIDGEEFYEIQSGQCRFETCKALGLYVYYIVEEGEMPARTTRNINSAVAPETARDSIRMQAFEGIEKYEVLYKILNEFDNLNLNNIGYIVKYNTDITSAMAKKGAFYLDWDIYKEKYDSFKCINDLLAYCEELIKTKEVKKWYFQIERLSYAIATCTHFINLDYDRLKHKIKIYLSKPDVKNTFEYIVDKHKDMDGFMEILDKTYNYMPREGEEIIPINAYYTNYKSQLNLTKQLEEANGKKRGKRKSKKII